MKSIVSILTALVVACGDNDLPEPMPDAEVCSCEPDPAVTRVCARWCWEQDHPPDAEVGE